MQADWLSPGSLFISLDRDSGLSDGAIAAMDHIVSDDRDALCHAKSHEAAFTAVDRVDGDLTDAATGAPPRRRAPHERIAVLVNGLGIEDLAAAVEVYRVACERGVGTVLPAQSAA